MPGKHALLSASSSARWLACPPSAVLESQFPESTSPYAEEGTKAHAVCELRLRAMRDGLDFDAAVKELGFVPDQDMMEFTELYEDLVTEEYNAAKANCKYADLLIERQVSFKEYVPDGFGTADALIATDSSLTIIDFKYGQGVRVSAQGNSQLRLYALGAYHALSPLYDFKKVRMTIVQPRLSHVDTEEIAVKDLLAWGEEVKKVAAIAAKGEGEFHPGDHCRFCRAAGTCRARMEAAFEVIQKSDTKPALLLDDEVPVILDRLDNAEEWIKAFRQYAKDRALSGKQWAGYKLVEGRSNRKIEDQVGAYNALIAAGYDDEDISKKALKGISDLERLCGKARFAELLGSYVVKPHGEPTLVKESDKRETYNPIEQAFKEE